MNKENNKKAQNTKQRIAIALIKLMQNDIFNEITITQICQEAEIGRASFYRNFESKEDVIRYVVSYKLDEILKDVDNLREVMIDGEKFYEVFHKEEAFLTLIMSNELFLVFLRCFYRYVLNRYELDVMDAENKYYDYVMGMITYQIVGMIDIWVSRKCKDNAENFKEIIDIHPKILRK